MLTKLKELVGQLEQLSSDLGLEVDPLIFGTAQHGLQINLDFYFKLKKIKEIAANLEGFFNKNDAALSERINKQVAVLGVDSVDKEVDGTRYRIKAGTKIYVNVKKEMKPEFLEFMRKHPIGKELMKEDVHHKSLESFVTNDLIGNGELPPPCISMHTAPTLETRKLPK